MEEKKKSTRNLLSNPIVILSGRGNPFGGVHFRPLGLDWRYPRPHGYVHLLTMINRDIGKQLKCAYAISCVAKRKSSVQDCRIKRNVTLRDHFFPISVSARE